MEKIELKAGLSIKKLDPNSKEEVTLIKDLEQDDSISGVNGYLWPLSNSFKNTKYLETPELYNSPYAIYHNQKPIGYLEISSIFQTPQLVTVDLVYALHKEARKHGYMTQVVQEVSNLILTDKVQGIESVTLIIDPRNQASRNVARQAGFIEDNLKEEQRLEQGYVLYQKTKKK